MKRAAPVPLPPLTLDRRRALSPQIAEGLRVAMHTGRLRPGDRVPSSRTLARSIRVSRQVVVAAYEELAVTGYLRGRTGDGSYVSARAAHHREGAAKRIVDPDGFAIHFTALP